MLGVVTSVPYTRRALVASRPRTPRPFGCRPRGRHAAVKCTAQQAPDRPKCPLSLLSLALSAPALLAAAPALAADDFIIVEPEPADPLITVLFALAMLALAIMTLGVAYLSISGWLDSRAETEERKNFKPAGPSSPAAAARQEADDSDDVAERRKKRSARVRSDRGFGG